MKVISKESWRDRNIGMICKTCVFYVLKVIPFELIIEGQESIGRCRRHAPSTFGFPVVYDSDWCGDHKLDENMR